MGRKKDTSVSRRLADQGSAPLDVEFDRLLRQLGSEVLDEPIPERLLRALSDEPREATILPFRKAATKR